MRGMLTDEIKEKAKKLLDIDCLSTSELRLMPYIQHIMINNQKLDPNKINAKDRMVLSCWRGKGFIEGGAGGLTITKQFWDAINEILWIAYVDIN